jgi:hypothetical protein
MVVATNERREDEEQTLRGEEEEEDKALRAANEEANMMVCARTKRDKMKKVRHKIHPENGFNS